MPTSRMYPGPHELGQNLLRDRRVVADIVDLASVGPGPVVEWAAGDGAITRGLATLGRPVEAVELDHRRVAELRRRLPPHVCITEGDILRHAPPTEPHTLVSNVPFHLTTPLLRRLLRLSAWRDAILVLQWEVARKRAGVGGATLLTAQWWPWFEFSLVRRVPATAFRPRPSVDAGILHVSRREEPLVPGFQRRGYQDFVRAVFTGSGRGLPQVLTRAAGCPPRAATNWCHRSGLTARHRVKDLRAEQWASAFTDLAPRRHRHHRR